MDGGVYCMGGGVSSESSLSLSAAALAGGALAAGGANAINMVVDRDIDRLMNRTKNRPLVTGAIAQALSLPTAFAAFALALATTAAAVAAVPLTGRGRRAPRKA